MTPRWWRTNRVGLIASAVSAVLLTIVVVVLPWADAVPPPPAQHAVSAGGRLAWNGRSLHIRAAGVFTGAGSRITVPKGTELVAMIIDVQPGAAARRLSHTLCDAQLIAPGPTGERAWEPEASSALADLHYGIQDGSDSYCILDKAEAVKWEIGFVVPAGTYDRAHLTLKLVDKPHGTYRTRYYRLSLPTSPERH